LYRLEEEKECENDVKSTTGAVITPIELEKLIQNYVINYVTKGNYQKNIPVNM
jgi:hypothetical protein